jgi:hypothetical protein
VIEVIKIAVIALISGFASSMFGIGGSVVSSPMLAEFTKLTAIQAFATPLSTAFISSLAGSYVFFRKKMIHFKIASLALISAIPVSLLITNLTQYMNADWLLTGKTFLLLFIGLQVLFARYFSHKDIERKVKDGTLLCLSTGVAAGIISGLFAIGGGIVFVPLFGIIHGLKFKNAVATSLFGVIFISLFNSIYHYYLGNLHIPTAILLAIFVIPGSLIGARISSEMKAGFLSKLFGFSVIIFALYFIGNQFFMKLLWE